MPTCVVTGASSGIGAATATGVARAGYDLALIARDVARLEHVAQACRALGVKATTYRADFAELAQVRRLAGELLHDHPRLDVLVNNAGVILPRRTQTVDGYEAIFAVNHLAPYLLTRLLLDRLAESAPSRVVVVASDAHGFGDVDPDDWQSERDWKPMRAYGRSKLCNILFTAELSRRTQGRGVAVNCLHPGFVGTSLGRDHWLAPVALPVLRLFVKGPERGAQTSVALATTDLGADNGGRYFVDGKVKQVKPYAADAAKAARLWDDSARMVGLDH